MIRNSHAWAMACLAVLATALPLAAEEASHSRAGRSDDPPGRFPLGSKLTLGLVAGYTLTPDFRTGFLDIHNEGTVTDDGSAVLGLPPLVAHNVHRASYLRPYPSIFPLLGVFAETELTSRVSLQASVLLRELVEASDTIWTEPSQRRFSESERRYYYADFDRTWHKPNVIWEIPVLLKYRFGVLRGKAARVRPFVGAGPAFWFENHHRPHEKVQDPNHGVVAAIGFDAHWWKWTLSPQASYTRWATDADPHLSKNQVQITIGFSF